MDEMRSYSHRVEFDPACAVRATISRAATRKTRSIHLKIEFIEKSFPSLPRNKVLDLFFIAKEKLTSNFTR